MIRDTAPTCRHGFTLVELLAVIVILAVIVGLAIPRLFDESERARVAAARSARANLATAVVSYKLHDALAGGGEGSFPPSLDGILFSEEGKELFNPYLLEGQNVYHTFTGNNRWHPSQKIVENARSSGAIWYNPRNGSVKFRVPRQATVAETIALYNEVNACNVTSLGQTAP